MDSYSGKGIWEDLTMQFKRPEGQRIGQMVLKEFNPGGLVLPFGKVPKKFDGARVWRVVWKITRGLFFKETGRFLPDMTPRIHKLFTADEKMPEDFNFVPSLPSHGQYPGVFDYKYIELPKEKFHFWGILFWDKIIKFTGFHDPTCTCKICLDKPEK
jgi:hypothetical protein